MTDRARVAGEPTVVPAADAVPRPRFSVVIPTYNRAEQIEATLASCIDQAIDDIEMLVIDDGSTDHTLEALARIDDPRVRILSQANAGPAAARNHGMREARGDFIAFLDSDDRWLPGYLQQVSHAIEQHGDDCLFYGRIVVDRGVGRYWIKPDRALAANESIYDYLYLEGGFVQTSTIVVPRRIRDEVDWAESVTFGDNDQFAIDCWQAGLAFRLLPEALTVYTDILSEDALSQLPIHARNSDRHTGFFDWMADQRTRMSDRAWLGYRARFESVALAGSAPGQSVATLWTAWRGNAISTRAAVRQSLQNFTPRLYRRLTDRYVRHFGQDHHLVRFRS